MSTLATLNVALNGDISGFLKSMKDAENQARASSGVIGAALNGIGNVAKIAGIAAVAGIGALAGGLAIAVKEAADAEKNLAQLDAVLKSTNNVAGVSKDSILELAGALQKTTTFSDDQIIAADSLLLTFTNIGKEVFPEATRAVLDMSIALGQDTKTSAIQLGKALNDPVKGVTALRKVGVSFTEEQMKMIKSMAAAGDVMGAQKMILKELQTEFGGSAEAAGKTFSGSLEILKNIGLDILETIGMALLPMLTQLAQGLQTALASPIVQDGIEMIQAGLNHFTTVILPQIITALQNVVTWVKTNWPLIAAEIGGAFERAKAVVEPIINAIGSFIRAVFDAVRAFMQTHGEEIKSFLAGAWDNIRSIIETAASIISGVVTSVFGAIASFIQEHGGWIQSTLDFVWKQIRTIVETAIGAIKGVVNTVLSILKGDWQTAWTTIKNTVETIWNGIRTLWDNFWGGIDSTLRSMGVNVHEAWDRFWNGVRDTVVNIWNGILRFLEGVVNGAIDIINGIIQGFNDTIGQVVGTIELIPHISLGAARAYAAGGYALGAAFSSGFNAGLQPANAAIAEAARAGTVGGGMQFAFGDINIYEAQAMSPAEIAQAIMDEAGKRADSRIRLR